MESISIDTIFKFDFAYISTREVPRTSKTINFIPDDGDEVIRDKVSHKLDRPIGKTSNEVWRD